MNINCNVQAVFNFTIRNKDTLEPIYESGDSPNIVLDNGLKRLGSGGVCNYCRVGTGSTTPTATQTQLDVQVAYTSTTQGSSTSGVDSAKGYVYKRKTFRFPAGSAAGNLTEVGVGWGESGETLFNRALIRDTAGHVTTVTVLDDEVLDVTVELRAYMALSTKSTTGIISDVSYELSVAPLFTNKADCFDEAYKCTSAVAYGGDILNTTTLPSQESDHFSVNNKPYNNDLTKEFEIYWGLNQGNRLPTRTIVIHSPYSSVQFQFNPQLPKTAEKVLKLGFKFVWGRYE